MIPDWFVQESITDAVWVGVGSVIVILARNRIVFALKSRIVEFANEYVAQFLVDIQEHPENIRPVINSLMKQVLANPQGIVPKEATVKVPLLGKLPAAWFEPLIKRGISKLVGSEVSGDEKTENSGLFG